jgi:hypothetical protein
MSKPLHSIKTFIFTALSCEAKPLVSHFKLKKDIHSHPFPLYYNDDTVLAVSGCGKVAMAAAVGYTLAWFKPQQHPVLVNVGIAGHQTAAIGELFAAYKITDTETGRNFYPQMIAKLPCSTSVINTVCQPQTDYAAAELYEMEASGFYEIASRFSSSELIHVFKIVSDNQHAPITAINSALVTQWITARLPKITEAIKALLILAQPLAANESPYYQPIVERWHFTVNASVQLKALLQRWQVLTDNAELDFNAAELAHSKAVLNWLEQKLSSLSFSL